MNGLTVAEIQGEIQSRRQALQTKQGFADAKKVMRAMFDYLANSGYKMPDTEYDEMAGAYADQLREHIAIYGYNTIKKAVREFVRNDRREYHPIPTTGQIIGAIEEIAPSPLKEIRRKELDDFIEKITVEAHKEALDEWNKLSKDEREKLEVKYGRNRKDKDLEK